MLSGVAAGLVALGIGLGAGTASATNIAPADPQPDQSSLKPGLAVEYYYGDYKDIDELYELMKGSSNPGKGDPLPNLDYRVGEGRNVLTTKYPRFVGAHITGYMKFAEAGSYNLIMTSNDGVRFHLGSEMLWEDPDVHADRDSEPLPVVVGKPGWIALDIGYFQRKGSSALILKWQGPKGGEFEVVPPEAFAHVE